MFIGSFDYSIIENRAIRSNTGFIDVSGYIRIGVINGILSGFKGYRERTINGCT